MPKVSRGEQRPGGAISLAVMVGQIVIGKIECVVAKIDALAPAPKPRGPYKKMGHL